MTHQLVVEEMEQGCTCAARRGAEHAPTCPEHRISSGDFRRGVAEMAAKEDAARAELTRVQLETEAFGAADAKRSAAYRVQIAELLAELAREQENSRAMHRRTARDAAAAERAACVALIDQKRHRIAMSLSEDQRRAVTPLVDAVATTADILAVLAETIEHRGGPAEARSRRMP